MAGRPIRLGKAAGELNVGLPTIIEFLSSKGITIDTNPNTKLDKEHYEMLCDEFAADQDLKEKSKGVLTNREKRESLSIEDTKKEEPPVVKEEPHLNVEEIKRKVAEEEAPVKPEAGLKVVGNIDLNALKPKKKAEEKKVEAPKATVAKEETPKTEDAKKEEPVKKEEPSPSKKEEAKKEEPASPKKDEIETIKIERKKITGPTVLGKIELPVEKQRSSSNSRADNANKRKRKRIKKVETPSPGAKGGNSKFQSNKPQKA
jgi:translation initiation factor IF-2